VTAAEIYELTTQGGATDFARVVSACELYGPWCLIGGLAVNVYVEPVYTLDAEFTVFAPDLQGLSEQLREQGFARSDLRIQFTTDPRYQVFPARSVEAIVLGVPVRVASLQDTAQGKLWAYGDSRRRFSKRKKDELDLIRQAEAWPELRCMYPRELLEQIDRG
jgi:hypothetical protein